MPRRDGTGPAGMGPVTGAGEGVCAGYGRGAGRGRGGRAGMCLERKENVLLNAEPLGAMQPQDEKELLEAEAQDLEARLKQVREKISDPDNEGK